MFPLKIEFRLLIIKARAYESENVELITRVPLLSVECSTPIDQNAVTFAGSDPVSGTETGKPFAKSLWTRGTKCAEYGGACIIV